MAEGEQSTQEKRRRIEPRHLAETLKRVGVNVGVDVLVAVVATWLGGQVGFEGMYKIVTTALMTGLIAGNLERGATSPEDQDRLKKVGSAALSGLVMGAAVAWGADHRDQAVTASRNLASAAVQTIHNVSTAIAHPSATFDALNAYKETIAKSLQQAQQVAQSAPPVTPDVAHATQAATSIDLRPFMREAPLTALRVGGIVGVFRALQAGWRHRGEIGDQVSVTVSRGVLKTRLAIVRRRAEQAKRASDRADAREKRLNMDVRKLESQLGARRAD